MTFPFDATATTPIYTLSLHDALPIFRAGPRPEPRAQRRQQGDQRQAVAGRPGGSLARRRDRLCDGDRKSTRLNSSHVSISYAVFCLKKKKKKHSSLFFGHPSQDNLEL